MGQWKEVERNKFTGFLDKNGLEIKMGDRVSFRRKVRAEYNWDRYNSTVKVVAGHYKTVVAEVVGFGRIVKKHHYNRVSIQIEYVNLQESKNRNIFRVYRTENLTVIQ